MKAIWTGSISFGLVNIPVELYPAENRYDLHFHLLDGRNNGKIHYERINDETGKEVPWDNIVKAYEVNKDSFVILKPDDFKRAAPKAFKTIDIEDFVDLDEIEYIYFDRPYYMTPGKAGEKGYVLLREALKKTRKVGIAKIVIRTKEYLAAILPQGQALMLNLLRFGQELRSVDEFAIPDKPLKDYHINSREVETATQLINALTNKWQPKKYHDEYRDALMKWIETKASHKKHKMIKEVEEAPASKGKVIDFMPLLKKSVDQTKHQSKKTTTQTKNSRAKKRKM